MKRYTPDNVNIAVIGGGNVGTQFACFIASKGFCVNVFSSKPELYDGCLQVIDERGNITTGKINKVSADIEEVMDGCSIVFITHPAYNFKSVADQILPYVHDKMEICVVPGTGGAEFAFRKCMQAGAVLSGLQRVPSVARLVQYGKSVRCEGLRNELKLGTIPFSKGSDMADFLAYVWGIPCRILPNYLSVTLTPSNPILHTTRLRTLFSDYAPGVIYERNPLFYGEWTDDSSRLLISCDTELQQMLRIMDRYDLREVISLKQHYESSTPEAMTNKLRSISSLNKIHSPMVEVEGGWIPDFKSRYFTADFPYGLAIIEELADILCAPKRYIAETMDWYRKVTVDNSRFSLKEYGIYNLEDLYNYYGTLDA